MDIDPATVIGTGGLIITYYKGHYVIVSIESDSGPDVLGVKLLREIPREPDEFKGWLDHKRKDVEKKVKEWEKLNKEQRATLGYRVRTVEKHRDMLIVWDYLFDLETLILAVNMIPLFRLNDLPSPEDFVNYFVDKEDPNYLDHDAQWEYMLSVLGKPAPAVSAHVLELYSASKIEFAPLVDVLDCPEEPYLAELSRVELMEIITLGYYRDMPETVEVRIPSLRSRADITPHMSMVARSLLGWFFESLLALPKGVNFPEDELRVLFGIPQRRYLPETGIMDEFWWPRPHICVTLDTHLDNPDNLKAAIIRIVTAIKNQSLDSTKPVFGVIFSFSQIVILSHNEKDQACIHTPALDFFDGALKSTNFRVSFDTFSSDGISALTRLAFKQYPTLSEDLLMSCHMHLHLLSSAPKGKRTIMLSDTREPPPAHIWSLGSGGLLKLLPEEILYEIGEYLDFKSLLAYCSASIDAAKAMEDLLSYAYVQNVRLDCPLSGVIGKHGRYFEAFDLENKRTILFLISPELDPEENPVYFSLVLNNFMIDSPMRIYTYGYLVEEEGEEEGEY